MILSKLQRTSPRSLHFFPNVTTRRVAGLILTTGLLVYLSACKPDRSDTLFSELPAAETGVDFINRLPEQSAGGMNIVQYLYYYNGAGVAVGDLNNDSLPDLYFTANLEPDRLYLNRGNFKFEDVTRAAGVAGTGSWKTGVTMADVNADGWLDIYVCQVGNYKAFHGKNQLFINNHDGTFTDRAAEYGLDLSAFCTQAVFFDYDRDNDLDCFVLCHSVHSTASYKDTSISRRFDPLASDRLFRNDQGRFTDITAQSGLHDGTSGYGLGVTVGDVNGDGFPDIYVANDFHENDFLYYNIEGRYFREGLAESMGHSSNFSMGVDMADLNNDGRADILSLDMKPEDEVTLKSSQPPDQYPVYEFKHSYGYHWQFPRNNLQLNQGPKDGQTTEFSEIGQLAGIAATDWSWSALSADFDLDGHKDIYITNGIPHRPNDMDYIRFTSTADMQKNATDLQLVAQMPPGEAHNYAFRNTQGLAFEDVSEKWGLRKLGCTNGAAWADLDNDGDLDLIANNLNQPASLYRNNSTGRNYLKIKLQGAPGNPFAVGARVTLYRENSLWQMQELQPVRGFESSVEPVLVFGLDTLPAVSDIRITWPDGSRQMLNGPISANQTLLIRQDSEPDATAPAMPAPAFTRNIAAIQCRPAEVEDISRQKLIPWSLATQGPRVAVGDADGDGIDELYLPQPGGGRLLRQTASGFSQQAIPWSATPGVVETCAAFFDADGDGAPDLYIGTGGNAFSGGDPGLRDVLLLNDGRGHFDPKRQLPLPEIFENTACVRPCDFDGDGDPDLFVGSRSVSGAYGTAPRSYLLKNDGRGHFSIQSAPWGDRGPGMVTDAQWADVTGDGRPDLLLCGEWMPLTVYRNTGSGFDETPIPHSSGLWNSLSTADLDGDGDLDLVAGNFGLNSILRATAEHPLNLWVKDIDHNGSTDPVLSYYRDGKSCVFADKDWLISQLPAVKKRYVRYRQYAESSFEDVFPAGVLKGTVPLPAEILESCWVENLGNGHWSVHPLPGAAQFSPVFALQPGDFDGDRRPDILLGGNLYEVQPAISRQDAGCGLWLRGNGRGGFEPAPVPESGFRLEGAIRDIRVLRAPGGRQRILAVPNAGNLQYFDLQTR